MLWINCKQSAHTDSQLEHVRESRGFHVSNGQTDALLLNHLWALEMAHCNYSSSHFTGFMRKHGQAVLVPVPWRCLQKAGSELCNTVENNMAYHPQGMPGYSWLHNKQLRFHFFYLIPIDHLIQDGTFACLSLLPSHHREFVKRTGAPVTATCGFREGLMFKGHVQF